MDTGEAPNLYGKYFEAAVNAAPLPEVAVDRTNNHLREVGILAVGVAVGFLAGACVEGASYDQPSTPPAQHTVDSNLRSGILEQPSPSPTPQDRTVVLRIK